ncbi:DUF1972 domain-containing protein [Proteus penneri]|uniref:Gt3 n=1 Tax=Proteus penneri TaxID=102862 RepID=A0A385JNM0_9GAMM|nr:DUF1972 domain-containing protein [Proteus penneri]AXY99945.1 gt3 [Proteus penneri]
MYKLSIVGTVGVPACYGGFETLVENLLVEKNNKEYLVYASSRSYSKKINSYKNADIKYLPFKANGTQSIIYDVLSILHSAFILKPQNILILGVSGTLILPFVRPFFKGKIITNIDGLEWKRDKWNRLVKKFLKFSEKLAVKYSDIVITDNQGISDYVFKEYDTKSMTIAYGGNIPEYLDKIETKQKEYYLKICRIEPENNVEMVLKAFSIHTDSKLILVGNWNASNYGKSLRKNYISFDNIKMLDPIYDPQKLHILRSECAGYIHGHSAGGTNPSLVEIMHYGKIIYAYDCIYNRYTTNNISRFFSSPESLISLLKKNSNNDDILNECHAIKNYARLNYSWEKIREKYLSCI